MTTKVNASVLGWLNSATSKVITLTDSLSASGTGYLYFGKDKTRYISSGDANDFNLAGANLTVNSGAGTITGYSFSGTATYATKIVAGGNTGGMVVFNHNNAATSGTPTYVYGSSDGLTWTEYSPSNFAVSSAGSATNAGNLDVGGTYRAASTAATINTIAARDGSADIYASTFRGNATSANYADVAENYLADAEYEPGTVVVFGGEKEITESKIVGDRRVAGVVSTNPAYLMNDQLENGTPVALTGRVPCKVMGYIRKGDLMITSHIPGVARADNEAKVGTVIGKALEDYQSTEVGVIEVVVGRV